MIQLLLFKCNLVSIFNVVILCTVTTILKSTWMISFTTVTSFPLMLQTRSTRNWFLKKSYSPILNRHFGTPVTTSAAATTEWEYPPNNNNNNNNHKNNDKYVYQIPSVMDGKEEWWYYDRFVPHDLPRRKDVIVALKAVQQACSITEALQPCMAVKSSTKTTTTSTTLTVWKVDLSPVTVADLAVQAVILHHLNETYGSTDGFIAEEDSSVFDKEEPVENGRLLRSVGSAVMTHAPLSTLARVLHHEQQQQSFRANDNQQQLRDAIDLGKSYKLWESQPPIGSKGSKESSPPPRRIWCLDPIDGTRGFLRGKQDGGQYCIALALIEDGIPVVGILGCPNLPIEYEDFTTFNNRNNSNNSGLDRPRGCIFVASRDGGCYQLPLLLPLSSMTSQSSNINTIRRLFVTINDGTSRLPKNGRFCIGVEQYSDALGQVPGMIQYVRHDGTVPLPSPSDTTLSQDVVRMDSQAKHGCIASGWAEYYVRLPKPGYIEYIWDHAAGNVVIEEAGGTMTDTEGKPIDFSPNRHGPSTLLSYHQLSSSVKGVLMSNGGIFHNKLVSAYRWSSSSDTNTDIQ